MAGLRIPQLPALPGADVVSADKLLVFDTSTDQTVQVDVGTSLPPLFGTPGDVGYVLTSTGAGAVWAPAPTGGGGSSGATSQHVEHIATAGQTAFQTIYPYTVGYVGVYVNGVRLSETEFDASDGLNVMLFTPCAAGDVVLLEAFLGSGVATPGPPGPEGPPGDQTTFIGDSPPPSPVHGQTWWESDSGNTFIYYDDGTSAQWVPAHVGASPSVFGGTITIGPTAPTAPSVNQVWIDTN